MNRKQTIEKILSQVENISNFDLSKLSPEGPSVGLWRDMETEETAKFVEGLWVALSNLTANAGVLDDLPPNQLEQLKDKLDQFVNHYQPLSNLDENKITTHHHNCLNNLQQIGNLMRSAGLYTQLKLAKDFDRITKNLTRANKQLKEFDENEFKVALNLVHDLNREKVNYEKKVISNQQATYIQRASEHKIWGLRGQWFWLFFALGAAVFIVVFAKDFIDALKDAESISVGVALMRISLLVVPSYFVVFFIEQFTYHKKMYDLYCFKATSLKTMKDLMVSNQNMAHQIMEKGLSVLFSEPIIKDSEKNTSKWTNEIIGILKNQNK